MKTRIVDGNMCQRMTLLLAALALAAAPIVGCEGEERVATAGVDPDVAVRPGVYGTPDTDAEVNVDPAAPGTQRVGPIGITWTGPDEIRAGERFTYRAQVTNHSQTPVHQVRLRLMRSGESQARQQQEQQQPPQQQQEQQQEQQDPAAQKQPADAKQQQQRQQRPGQTWEVGMLMPGESRVVEIQDSFATEGQQMLCLAVEYEPMACKVVNVVKPELRLTRYIVNAQGEAVRQAYVCDEIFALYRVENIGTGETGVVTVRDQFGSGITVNGQQQFEARLESLDPGASADARVPLTVTDSAVLTGRATASTEQLQVQSAYEDVEIRFLKPELALTLDGPARQYPGRIIQYTATVTNTSDDPAVRTVVALAIPETARDASVSTGQYDPAAKAVAIGQLTPGQSRQVTVSYYLDNPGQIQFAAAASAYCVERVEKTATTEIVGIPALRIEMIDLLDPVPQGETTTYAVRLKNQGTKEDLNIKLTGTLPAELEFVRATGDSEVQAQGKNLTFGNIDKIAPGQTIEWRVQAKGTAAGRGQLELKLRSDASQEPVVENEPTTVY